MLSQALNKLWRQAHLRTESQTRISTVRHRLCGGIIHHFTTQLRQQHLRIGQLGPRYPQAGARSRCESSARRALQRRSTESSISSRSQHRMRQQLSTYKCLHMLLELVVHVMSTVNRNNAFTAGCLETAGAQDSMNQLWQMGLKQRAEPPRHTGLPMTSKAGATRRKHQVNCRMGLHGFKIEEHNAAIPMAVHKVPRATAPAAVSLMMTATAARSQAPILERRATGRHLRPFDLCRDLDWAPRDQLTGRQGTGLTSEYTSCKRAKRRKGREERAL